MISARRSSPALRRRRLSDRTFLLAISVDSGFNFNETDDDIFNCGIGLRYLALPQQDTRVGVDIAHGPEDSAWYIQIGSSW